MVRGFFITIYTLLFSLSFCDYSYSKEEPLFAETCYIDSSYVLLYKIINWWNDSEPGADNILCGNTLKWVHPTKAYFVS